MTLREIILQVDFEKWKKEKSIELFGENPEYIESLFLPIFKVLKRMAKVKGKQTGSIELFEDGIFAKFRVNDVPLAMLLDTECSEELFDLVMWELARSGKKWSS